MSEKNTGHRDLSGLNSDWSPEEREAAFSEYIEWGLEELDDVVGDYELSEESRVVIGSDSDYFTRGEYHVMSVNEAREVIKKMRDSDNVISRGYPIMIAILSANSEEFEKEKTKRIRDNQKRLLSAVEGYDDQDPVFYLVEGFDKMRHIHKSTVVDIRKRAFELDHADVLNSVYAIPEVISVGDPDFDQEAWAQEENERSHRAFIETIEKVQRKIDTVSGLLNALDSLDPSQEVTIVLRGAVQERFKLTAAEAHMKVRHLSLDGKISDDDPPLLII